MRWGLVLQKRKKLDSNRYPVDGFLDLQGFPGRWGPAPVADTLLRRLSTSARKHTTGFLTVKLAPR
jgi:hypothetical protein